MWERVKVFAAVCEIAQNTVVMMMVIFLLLLLLGSCVLKLLFFCDCLPRRSIYATEQAARSRALVHGIIEIQD